MLAGLGLEPDGRFVEIQNLGDPPPDGRPVWQDFGPLGENHAIQVHDVPARGGDPRGGGLQHPRGIAAPVGWIGVGKHLADVAQAGGSEEGISDGVKKDVGIRVADRGPVMRDRDTTEPERLARAEAMRIVPKTDPNSACHE